MTADAAASIVDAVRRTCELEPGEGTILVTTTLSTYLAPAPARLWPLLTRPEELARWYGPIEGDLREGGEFRAPGGAGGRILEAVEPHKLDLTWEYQGKVDSLLIRIDPMDDGASSLDLVHTTAMPREVFDAYGPGASAVGWDIALLGLAAFSGGWDSLSEHPVPTPTPQWLATAQGAAFVAAWSIRWGGASAAAGTDPALSRAGELATTAAYGGAAGAVTP